MCNYLAFTPHWHYNQEVGEGPENVIKYESGTGDNQTTRYKACVGNIASNYQCERRQKEDTDDATSDWRDWGARENTAVPSGYSCGTSTTEHYIKSGAEIQYENSNTKVTAESDAIYQYRCVKKLNTNGCREGNHNDNEEVEKVVNIIKVNKKVKATVVWENTQFGMKRTVPLKKKGNGEGISKTVWGVWVV